MFVQPEVVLFLYLSLALCALRALDEKPSTYAELLWHQPQCDLAA